MIIPPIKPIRIYMIPLIKCLLVQLKFRGFVLHKELVKLAFYQLLVIEGSDVQYF